MKKRNNYLLFLSIIISIIVVSRLLYLRRLRRENFTNPETYDIIILGGQSNSVGRGSRNHDPSLSENTISKGKISPDDDANINIKQLQNDGKTIGPGVEPMISGTDRGKRNEVSIGHSLSFAKEYLSNNPGKKILILACGYSNRGSAVLFATASNNNKRWFWLNNSDDSLFFYIYKILERAKQRNLISSNSSVKVLLWDQGESDTGRVNNNQNADGERYKNTLKDAFINLRSNIKILLPTTDANFPILVAGMCVGQNYFNNNRITGSHNGREKEGAYTFRINMNSYLSTMVTTLNREIRNVRFVPTINIPGTPFPNVLQCDSTINSNGRIINENNEENHFSATSQRELGKRFYYYFTR
jgi:hypothetical protein